MVMKLITKDIAELMVDEWKPFNEIVEEVIINTKRFAYTESQIHEFFASLENHLKKLNFVKNVSDPVKGKKDLNKIRKN